jgi:hypothetical protein
MKYGISIVAVAALMMAGLMSGTANADIMITITEALDGGFTMVGVGSGTTTAGKTENDWDIKDFPTNFIIGSCDGAAGTTTSGLLKNITLGTSTVIDEIEIDDDSGSGAFDDDISIENDGDQIFNSGDSYEINFTSTYTASDLLYSKLIEGTHIHPGGGDGAIFGTTTINVVPEPATMSVLAIGGLALLRRKRRRA